MYRADTHVCFGHVLWQRKKKTKKTISLNCETFSKLKKSTHVWICISRLVEVDDSVRVVRILL